MSPDHDAAQCRASSPRSPRPWRFLPGGGKTRRLRRRAARDRDHRASIALFAVRFYREHRVAIFGLGDALPRRCSTARSASSSWRSPVAAELIGHRPGHARVLRAVFGARRARSTPSAVRVFHALARVPAVAARLARGRGRADAFCREVVTIRAPRATVTVTICVWRMPGPRALRHAEARARRPGTVELVAILPLVALVARRCGRRSLAGEAVWSAAERRAGRRRAPGARR